MYYISHLQLLCLKPTLVPPSSANQSWKKPLLARKKLQQLQLGLKPHFSHDWLAPCELTPIF